MQKERWIMKSYMAKKNKVEQKWLLVDAEGAVLGRMAAEIAPILMDYWIQTKNTSDAYILRLKFVYDYDRKNNWSDHGISIGLARTAIPTAEKLLEVFRATYVRLLGSEMMMLKIDGKIKKRGARDYLKDEASIFISGATLESRSYR